MFFHDSVLKCIKCDRKIQDMGQRMYLFMFHMIKITQSMQFFSSKISTVTNMILMLYNSSEVESNELHLLALL